MTANGSASRLLRFGLVGIASNIAGYLVYLLLTGIGGTPKLTMTVLYGVGATIGFIGNREFTFAHQGSVFKAVIRYILTQCVGYLINLVILIVMVDHLGYSHQWVQAVAILVVAMYLFLAFRYFVFAPANAVAGGGE